MKIFMIIVGILLCHASLAQITLKECLEAGLESKPSLHSAQKETVIAQLKTLDAQAKYLPQVAIAYDYRYNTIIPTQVVPIGQFNITPTNETRNIQFGTEWQQNVGITVYQPIIDFVFNNRIKESKLKEALSKKDLEMMEKELKFEIVKTFNTILISTYQLEEAIADTMRSFKSYQIIQAKFNEGRPLKTDLNNSLINHHSNVISYKKVFSGLLSDKIYMHYLTNIELKRILEGSYVPIPEEMFASSTLSNKIQIESLLEFQEIQTNQQLIKQQIETEKLKYIPKIGLQGYVGGNQFSNSFTPFQNDLWFGNSYVGISVKMNIFSPSESVHLKQQLTSELAILESKKQELQAKRNQELLQINVEIDRLNEEIKFAENNLSLQKENIEIYQNRLQNGQFTAAELNVQEIELQKLSSQLKQLTLQKNNALIERLNITEVLNERLERI